MEADQEDIHSNNVLLFRLVISNNFKRIAQSVSEDEFAKVFTILQSKPKILRKLHKALEKELYDNMNDDLDDIINEGSLQQGLSKVSKLSDAYSFSSEDAWRPPGNISLHLRSLDAQKIKENSDELEKRLTALEEENASLMEKIAAERSRITAIDENITQCLIKTPVIINLLEERLESLEKSLAVLNHK